MHHRSLAWYTREEQSWSVWVNINIWTGKCSTSCAMISPLLFSFWARFCFCNWVLDKLNLQIWCLYGYMCIKGGGFWGFCDLTWGTKLYSGGDTTDFFFSFCSILCIGYSCNGKSHVVFETGHCTDCGDTSSSFLLYWGGTTISVFS